MAAWEGKKYKLEKSENFDEYMEALGVNGMLREIGKSLHPTIELVKDGDTYTLNTTSTFKNTSITFKLGEEFEEKTADGRVVKTKITADGDTFTQEQYGEKATSIVRAFTEFDMIATYNIGNITCTRVYLLSD